jgi:hypothetical protein
MTQEPETDCNRDCRKGAMIHEAGPHVVIMRGRSIYLNHLSFYDAGRQTASKQTRAGVEAWRVEAGEQG